MPLINKCTTLALLRKEIISCRRCPRLVEYRESVPCKATFSDQTYWRKPVPGFGDPNAWLLITGLAPAAHGGNRTGRVFTGDGSGRFLIRGLYEEGFANQPISESIDDGLLLKGCYVTAAVKCVPPNNKPTKDEFVRCSPFYHQEIHLLKNLRCVLALGRLAFDAYLSFAKAQGAHVPRQPFMFGTKVDIEGLPSVYACYHPSPRNTNTGLFSQQMLRKLLQTIKKDFRQ